MTTVKRWARGAGETAVVVGAFVAFGLGWAQALRLAVDLVASIRVTQ